MPILTFSTGMFLSECLFRLLDLSRFSQSRVMHIVDKIMNEQGKTILLTLAKSLGYPVITIQHGKIVCLKGGNTFHWNPLTCNSDAFELQIKLGLIVGVHQGYSSCSGFSELGDELHEDHGNDPVAATRRVIVHAALLASDKS
jgi:hypothetical protein